LLAQRRRQIQIDLRMLAEGAENQTTSEQLQAHVSGQLGEFLILSGGAVCATNLSEVFIIIHDEARARNIES
jgi:hypothetical protein